MELWEALPTVSSQGHGEGGAHPSSPAVAHERMLQNRLGVGGFRLDIGETPHGESGNPARESQNH